MLNLPRFVWSNNEKVFRRAIIFVEIRAVSLYHLHFEIEILILLIYRGSSSLKQTNDLGKVVKICFALSVDLEWLLKPVQELFLNTVEI